MTLSAITRRALLASPAAVAASTAFPSAPTPAEDDRARMIQVIEQLEAWQGWEASCVCAAKAFAAWQMRRALGLELPDPETAKLHVEYQASRFADYRRCLRFERDLAEGKRYEIAPFERALQ
jgi:hypothetical protein